MKGEPSMERALKKGSLISKEIIIIIVALIIGLLIGSWLSLTYIAPELYKDTDERIALLSTKNNIQTQQIQSYAQCLQKNNVALESCEQK
ncbi:MAG: hypothetical protein Q7S21_02005 [archaeon]|nr:hypothetical protein [archaeon]